MKRIGYIYDRIYTMENLRLAHKQASKDKSHYNAVRTVNKNPDYYLRQIQELLQNKTYEVSPYTYRTIWDKGKERKLSKLPYFPDRIIQWAIMLQLESTFNKTFTSFTCASLKGRGIHQAAAITERYLQDTSGTAYCLKIDVRKFYPNINHVKLKELLSRKFKDPDLLELLSKIIDSIPGGVGLPIGSYLSQYLANFYLTYFDHYLKEQLKVEYVVRYMDDVIILTDSKERAHQLRQSIATYLATTLKLELKHNWQVFPVDARGIDFVGYRHFHDYRLLRKSTCKTMKRKLRRLKRKVDSGKDLSYRDYCSANSYKGWLKWCNSYRLQDKYLAPLKSALDKYHSTKIKKKGGDPIETHRDCTG